MSAALQFAPHALSNQPSCVLFKKVFGQSTGATLREALKLYEIGCVLGHGWPHRCVVLMSRSLQNAL
jgi:hypothetical protein